MAFRPDGKSLVTTSIETTTSGGQMRTRVWEVPAPVQGEPERMVLWTQVITGMELDDSGTIRMLDAKTWQRHRQRLEELGGPPKPWRMDGQGGM